MFNRVDSTAKKKVKKQPYKSFIPFELFCISSNIDLYARLNKNKAGARQKLDASLAQKYLGQGAR